MSENEKFLSFTQEEIKTVVLENKGKVIEISVLVNKVNVLKIKLPKEGEPTVHHILPPSEENISGDLPPT